MLWYVAKESGRFLCVQVSRLAVMGSMWIAVPSSKLKSSVKCGCSRVVSVPPPIVQLRLHVASIALNRGYLTTLNFTSPTAPLQREHQLRPQRCYSTSSNIDIMAQAPVQTLHRDPQLLFVASRMDRQWTKATNLSF